MLATPAWPPGMESSKAVNMGRTVFPSEIPKRSIRDPPPVPVN